jgi:hypothetical protein
MPTLLAVLIALAPSAALTGMLVRLARSGSQVA